MLVERVSSMGMLRAILAICDGQQKKIDKTKAIVVNLLALGIHYTHLHHQQVNS